MAFGMATINGWKMHQMDIKKLHISMDTLRRKSTCSNLLGSTTRQDTSVSSDNCFMAWSRPETSGTRPGTKWWRSWGRRSWSQIIAVSYSLRGRISPFYWSGWMISLILATTLTMLDVNSKWNSTSMSLATHQSFLEWKSHEMKKRRLFHYFKHTTLTPYSNVLNSNVNLDGKEDERRNTGMWMRG